MDRNEHKFGRERLVTTLREREHESAVHLVERVFATLDAFTDGMLQSDDQRCC